MDMTHKVRCEQWTAIINECQKRHGAEPMVSPKNNSFTGREFSGRKLTNR